MNQYASNSNDERSNLSARRIDPRIAAFAVMWTALLALAPSHMLRDPGTFWHTVVGERMLTTGHIISTDPFSFTHQSDEWIAQQWLGECAMALVHRAAGLDGVVLLACTIIAAIVAVIFGRFARSGIPTALSIIATMIVIGASSYHFIPRPHLATLAGMTLLVLVLLDVEAGRVSPRRLWILPPLFIVWVNTHGGALGGLATLILFAIGWLARPRVFNGITKQHADTSTDNPPTERVPFAKPPAPLVGTVVGLCTIAALVNPFGPALPRVWIGLMGSRVIPNVIIEHAPLSLLSPEGIMILLLAIAYAWLLLGTRRRGWRVAWLLPAIWFVLALSRVRHGPLFAIVASLCIADMIPHHPACTRLIASMTPFRTIPRRHPAAWPFAATIGVVFAATLALQAAGWRLPIIGAGRCVADNTQWPVNAVAALDREIANTGSPVRVFNEMRFGGYLTYAAPDARIYIDDRCELHRDAGLLRYIELQKHPELIDGEMARYQFDFALIRHGSRVYDYMTHSEHWSLIHTDETAGLFRAVGKPPHSLAIAKPKSHG